MKLGSLNTKRERRYLGTNVDNCVITLSAMKKFKNKIIWITGASSGIGKALAAELASRGAILILSARNEQVLNDVKNDLANAEYHHLLRLDLANSETFDDIVKIAWQLEGRIDCLVNNGGISQRSLALDTQEAVDRKVMEVDYFGTINLTKLLVPKMLASDAEQKGCIVNIASVAGKVGTQYRSAYCAAKHALIGFMDCLRAEIADKGIRVLVVCPGWVQTNVSRNALTGDMTSFGELDKEIENGMTIEEFTQHLVSAIQSSKDEVLIASGLPKLAYHARRLMPNRFHGLMRKIYKKK